MECPAWTLTGTSHSRVICKIRPNADVASISGVLHLVWPLPQSLSSMVKPTRSQNSSWHSLWGLRGTQAPQLQQSNNTLGGGRWFVYVKQRNATASCWVLCAGGTCTLLRTSFVDRNTGRQSIRSGKYPRCSDLSLRGKNMHSMKARFVLLICKLSLGVVTL